jgi:fatty-acyl-CoA synthase
MGRPVAEVNAMTCPAATPVTLTLAPAQAYVRAKAAVAGEGLHIVTHDPADGVLEATASEFWSGLKHDLAVRVRPAGAGSRIDMRAVSRFGLNDLGAECRLITRLRSALQR